ncbi:MAG: Tyrosine-protein kinase MasK, partial [Planctomycetota bacterium]
MFHHGQELISGYRLEKLLGRGNCGEVWRASAPGGTWTALKLINLEARGGLRELRGLQHVKNLRHGCLLPIHAIWVLDNDSRVLREDELDRLWSSTSQNGHNVIADLDQSVPGILVVSMMLGEGNLLDRMLECQQAGHAGIPVDELLGYMEDAARGLDFLNAERHDFGEGPIAIQHCDIKPQNIMLVGGTAMICDFGLARVLSSCRGTTLMPGSPAYIAPECISGRQPSFTTDQYSLAVSYVELRTGTLPFQNTSISAVFDAHLKGTLDLSRLEGQEREVIRRA